ncbi:MAG: 3-deoxy-8-phosphooctulonate synthase [Pseudomonadota bacterium]|nr:3-deoxy-8-phosphooctulonate synthase [Pseudomonadota bacterium]
MQYEVKKYGISNAKSMTLIAGPCVVESEKIILETAVTLQKICQNLGVNFVFKASVDKANRTSGSSFRGLGIEEGLRILQKVKDQIGVPIITDIHDVHMVDTVAEVVDLLQIPAFLCRQTDLITKASASGLPVNIKKGQFLSPNDMKNVLDKAKDAGNTNIMLCERGNSFGYNNLVVDYRGLAIMRSFGHPVIFDATHSVQLPGGQGGKSGGERHFAPILAKAALSVGIAGIFAETHPDPDNALSDGPNSIPLAKIAEVIAQWQRIDDLAKEKSMQDVELTS